MRDDRLIVAGSMPDSGRAVIVYLARAITPGSFIVPPVRAECMYDTGISSLNAGPKKLIVRSGDSSTVVRDE